MAASPLVSRLASPLVSRLARGPSVGSRLNAKAVQPGGLRGRRVVSAGLRVVGGSVRGVVAASGGRGGIRRVLAVGIRAVADWVRLKGCSDTPVNGPFRRPKGLRGVPRRRG